VLVMVRYALALPIAVALHALFSRYNPGLSRVTLIVGIAGMFGVVVLQALILARAHLCAAGRTREHRDSGGRGMAGHHWLPRTLDRCVLSQPAHESCGGALLRLSDLGLVVGAESVLEGLGKAGGVMIKVRPRPGPRWLPAHALAIAFSLSHLTLDWGAQIMGGPIGPVITPGQALVLVIGSGLYALWAAALVVAGQGSRRAMAATQPLCAVGALGNGLSIVACPPPCGGAAPIGDLTHIGSLVFGVWAVYESWRGVAQLRDGRYSRAGSPGAGATGSLAR
jgi:hypothetical protein